MPTAKNRWLLMACLITSIFWYGFSPNISWSNLVRDIKVSTTNYINENKLVHGEFVWQRGSGAFT